MYRNTIPAMVGGLEFGEELVHVYKTPVSGEKVRYVYFSKVRA